MRRAFVVEVSEAGAAGGPFTGRVEHLLSGKAIHYKSAEELVSFIQRTLEAAASAETKTDAAAEDAASGE